jgi:hypothetical protein
VLGKVFGVQRQDQSIWIGGRGVIRFESIGIWIQGSRVGRRLGPGLFVDKRSQCLGRSFGFWVECSDVFSIDKPEMSLSVRKVYLPLQVWPGLDAMVETEVAAGNTIDFPEIELREFL